MSYTFEQFCKDIEQGHVPYKMVETAGLSPEKVEDYCREYERRREDFGRAMNVYIISLFPVLFIVSWLAHIFFSQDVVFAVSLCSLLVIGVWLAYVVYVGIRIKKISSGEIFEKIKSLHGGVEGLVALAGPTAMIGTFEKVRGCAHDALVQLAYDKLVFEQMSEPCRDVLERDYGYYSLRTHQLSESLQKNLALLKRLGLVEEDCGLRSIFDSARAQLQK